MSSSIIRAGEARMDDEEAAVRAAWLYYMEGLTQDRVAGRLGTTRLRVNRLLGEARTSGLVGITINSRLASCLALEDELKRAWGLADAVIVPTPQDAAQLPLQLGRATGEFLSRHLETHRVRRIGVGWGATLRETIRFVKAGQWPQLHVSSMMGGLTHGLEINTFETASALAARLGASCSYLAAPLYAGSPKSRDLLVAQDVFKESFAGMAANDVALLSVGDLSDKSLLIRYGLPRDVTVASLKRAHAVGDILGRFIDADGRPVDHPLSQRAISPPLETLAKIPTVIVTSGGDNKAGVIAAVLRGKLASVLVCDEKTAAGALKLAGG
ncbi:sugar-binding transcriptional regulator [Ramlibacter albus]|uniref:Sugar-binding transcriptional regulator n=1 Tax=Ramlibacter albus TaxID=2079448 RepID=A0A923MD34_9BURK|nr:sugar-binding transcriptional regulator [Ramlibacter albus]MBC5768480.1 sugar-binding transcriptional regulator [Ramlibacter albus]